LAQAPPGEHLIWLDAPEAPMSALESDWFAPLLEALRTRVIAHASLALADADRDLSLELTPIDLWKFWRRPLPAPS
jgi:hypothetical protein